MKKHGFMALGISAVIALSATASFAQQQGSTCSPEIKNMQQNYAAALKARDNAATKQIIKQPDSTLGLTCFDQSMAVTSQLGGIFSDKPAPNAPAANTSVFTPPLSLPTGAGTSGTLGSSLATIVGPTLSKELGNFPGALSAAMGALDSLFSSSGLSGALSGMLNDMLSGAGDLGIPGFPGGLGGLLGGSSGGATSGTSGQSAGGVQMNCQRMEQVWNSNNPDATAPSIQGSGITQGAPYATLQDILSGSPPGAGSSYLNALRGGASTGAITDGAALDPQQFANSSVLQSALSDLTSKNAPGSISSWPAAPTTLTSDSSTADIINQMKMQ